MPKAILKLGLTLITLFILIFYSMIILFVILTTGSVPNVFPATITPTATLYPTPTINSVVTTRYAMATAHAQAIRSVYATAAASLPDHCQFTNHSYSLHFLPKAFGYRSTSRTVIHESSGHIALIKDNRNNVELELLRGDGGLMARFNLTIDSLYNIKIVQWSPNGRYLALVEENNQTYHLNVYGNDGTARINLIHYVFDKRDDISIAWTPDSSLLMAGRHAMSAPITLHRYFPSTNQINDFDLQGQLVQPPVFTHTGDKIALYVHQENAPLELRVMDIDGRWQTVTNDINPYEDLYTYWLRDHTTLAYITQRAGGQSLETIHTQTKARQIIQHGMTRVLHLHYFPHANALTFWWQDETEAFRQSGYLVNGLPIYQLSSTNKPSWKPYEFWSPDGQTVALKLREGIEEQLVLAFTDGRKPLVVRSNLRGLGDPLWSPDSRMVAFSQFVGRKQYPFSFPDLIIVSADGQTLWTHQPFSINSSSKTHIGWFPCT